MRRSFLFLLILLPILSGITTAQNRSDDWTAWLLSGRHLIQIDSEGSVLVERTLPLPPNYDYISCFFSSSETHCINVSRDNRLMLYNVMSMSQSQTAQMVVYDWQKNEIIQTFTYEAEIITPFGESLFSDLGDTFAFGYKYKGNWRVAVVDIQSGKLLKLLNSADLPQIPSVMKHSSLPLVQQFDGNRLKFTLLTLSGESKSQGFAWNLITDDLRGDYAYPNHNSETFIPTGEVVNINYTCQDTLDIIRVYDPIERASFPFARLNHAADCPQLIPHFVQNGERILVSNSVGDQWTLVERDGKLISTWESSIATLIITNIRGTPNGFVYTVYLAPPRSETAYVLPAVFEVNTRDNQLDPGKIIWSTSISALRDRPDGGGNLEIIALFSDAPVGPFIPWAQLAPPVYEPTPAETLPPPTMIPTPEALFQVGMTVHVQTTGGEILNLRRDHSRKAEVMMYLEDNMKLTLLEGPIEAEGYIWWRVRTADGMEGWTVENNGELQTLIPG